MKRGSVLIAVIVLFPVFAASQKNNSGAIPLNSRLELFIDSLLIESMNNLELRMQSPFAGEMMIKKYFLYRLKDGFEFCHICCWIYSG